MQIKFCGLTRVEDIHKATQLGVDALGFVFYPPSPRAVTAEQAKILIEYVPAFVSVVALLVNISDDDIIKLAHTVPIDVLQFHGDESSDDCRRLAGRINKRWIKALRIDQQTHTPEHIKATIAEYANAGASSILLDAYHKDAYGGTGERFDWSLVPQDASLPIILAGGLTPNNVGNTLRLPVQAVDVSGGIESAKGIKDFDKMAAFVNNIRR